MFTVAEGRAIALDTVFALILISGVSEAYRSAHGLGAKCIYPRGVSGKKRTNSTEAVAG